MWRLKSSILRHRRWLQQSTHFCLTASPITSGICVGCTSPSSLLTTCIANLRSWLCIKTLWSKRSAWSYLDMLQILSFSAQRSSSISSLQLVWHFITLDFDWRVSRIFAHCMAFKGVDDISTLTSAPCESALQSPSAQPAAARLPHCMTSEGMHFVRS